ncbi:unnamed protein product [Heterobilharzia americana]|nr:unnamed protein product [Heterobilharzia americana]
MESWLMCQSNENDKPEVGTSSSLSSLSSPLSFPWRTSFRSNRFNHAQNNLPPLPRPVSFPLVESISQPTKRLHYSKSLHNFSNTFDTTYNSQSVVLESIHKSHALHYSWPLLKHLKNHNSVVNLCKMRNIQRVTSDCQKSQYTLQPTAETNNGIKEKLETEHNTTLSTENQNTSLANENEMAFVCDNEKKEDDTPTSHYLEMNLNESELEQDNRLVVLRNQSLLNKRIKAFSACSPPDIMLSNSSTEMSVKIFPNFTQSSSSTSMKERIISNRDNNDIFANLFFEKLSSAQPIKSSVYCSTSSYHANKHDKCTKKPLSYVSLQNSLQSSSLFSSSCQSTSTRSRNSLFNNAYSSIGADVTAVFSGSTLFNANCSSINRPRTSSDVSNMRRSGFCYSGSITQQSQVKQNQPPDNHSYQNRYFHTSNTIGCQLAPNSFSSLKLCRDLTSITESQETVNPVSRPRAATVGCSLLFGRQRLSAALNHIKLNWSKKQSTSQQKCSIHSKNISSDSLTTHNNKSSIHRKSEISRTKHLHMKQVEKEHDDEYVETFEMDMNLFPDNLEHLTCRTEAIPDLSNHYVIL